MNTFKFRDWELSYFVHPYNHTYQNMRAVEIPIVRQFLRSANKSSVLEVGNVLSHYQPVNWPVIDLREKGPQIINADVMSWQPEELFDVIISISTLEHIGHGKYTQFTSYSVTPAQVLTRILIWLKPNGWALLTVPLNYNKLLDQQLMRGEMPVDDAYYMRRISEKNEWAECTLEEAMIAERPKGYRWPVAMAALFCFND